MEVAVIDWKNIDSRFVRDELLENIHAPQWVDFTAPDADVDDESWFCRPDCNHPRTLEDFYKETTPYSKKSASLFERLPFGERNRSLRDASLKKRGPSHVSISPKKDLKYNRIIKDSENQNPNFVTPNYKAKSMKEAIKSSSEKKTFDESTLKKEQPRSLKSTLSARNLFAGGDILSKVTDFCNELKKLAMRSTARENLEEHVVKDSFNEYSGNLSDQEKERKPLLEVSTEKCKAQQRSILQEKPRRKKRIDDAENTPTTIDLKSIKCMEENSASQIRTCPPTPQCFSASHGPSKASPSKALKSRTLERRILHEPQEINVNEKEQRKDRSNAVENAAIIAEREAKGLDVLWFLKPCTLSS